MILYQYYHKDGYTKVISDPGNIPWEELDYNEYIPSIIQYNEPNDITNPMLMQWVKGVQTHRTIGPAMINYTLPERNGRYQWYLNNYPYKLNEWLTKNDYISDMDKMLIKLKYA